MAEKSRRERKVTYFNLEWRNVLQDRRESCVLAKMMPAWKTERMRVRKNERRRREIKMPAHKIMQTNVSLTRSIK